MARSTTLRTVATAMLIMGFLVALLGLTFIALGRPIPSAVAVVLSGLLQVMLGILFLSLSRR